MTVTAPPVEPEAPDPHADDRGAAAAIAAAAGRGLLAFGVVTAVGVAIGMAEYAMTKGAYRPWTWIKVGFLYVLSFCGVGLHAESTGVPGFVPTESHLQFRLPLMVGTALVVWLLFRAGRAAGEQTNAVGACVGVVAAALAFAVPAILVSLVARLRFPIGTISPVHWESAALPMGLALAAAAMGAFWGRRSASRDSGGWSVRTVAVLEGGWHMFLLGLGFAFVAFLVLAAVKPEGTRTYARFLRDAGRLGVVVAAHHVLLLPDQSVWLLAPAMGGSVQAVTSQEPSTTVTVSGIDEGALGRLFDPGRNVNGDQRLALGGGFYLFLLVPLTATVLGGRRAAAGSPDLPERLLRGLGAGVVFGALMAVAALLVTVAVPLPLPGIGILPLPVTLRATMPSTALLALAWGVLGGALGALSSRWPASAAADQEPAEPA